MPVQAADAPAAPRTLPASWTRRRGPNRDLWLGHSESRLAVQSESWGGQPAGHGVGRQGPGPRWQAHSGPWSLTPRSRVNSGQRQAGDPGVGIDATDLHGMERSPQGSSLGCPTTEIFPGAVLLCPCAHKQELQRFLPLPRWQPPVASPKAALRSFDTPVLSSPSRPPGVQRGR